MFSSFCLSSVPLLNELNLYLFVIYNVIKIAIFLPIFIKTFQTSFLIFAYVYFSNKIKVKYSDIEFCLVQFNQTAYRRLDDDILIKNNKSHTSKWMIVNGLHLYTSNVIKNLLLHSYLVDVRAQLSELLRGCNVHTDINVFKELLPLTGISLLLSSPLLIKSLTLSHFFTLNSSNNVLINFIGKHKLKNKISIPTFNLFICKTLQRSTVNKL